MKKIRKKIIPINNEFMDTLLKQREEFIKKFGREPGPDDPVMFDPDCDIPIPLSAEKLKRALIDAANKAGVDASLILKHFGFDIIDE